MMQGLQGSAGGNTRRMHIRTLSAEEMREVYDRFMVADFPEDELKSFRIIERLMKDGQYICCGVFRKNEADADAAGPGSGACAVKDLCGYGLYVFLEKDGVKHYLIDYLAIREDMRGRGVGSAFLRDVAGILPGPAGMCLVEAEDPEYAPDASERAVRERRIAFYERGGYYDTGVRACLFGVRYVILNKAAGRPSDRQSEYPSAGTSDRPVQRTEPDPQDIVRVYREIYEYMLGKELLAEKLQIIL